MYIKIFGTDNFRLVPNGWNPEIESNEYILYDSNTSNFDKTAVKTALNNLFNFRLGEAILEPMYGNNLYMYLYETMNKYTAEKISRALRQMIETWEPRIEIDNLDIKCDEKTITYYITIHYHIPELHDSDVYNLNLSR